jgi:hypothetical protein
MKITQFNAVVSIAIFNLLGISLPISHSPLVAPAAAQVNTSTPPPQFNAFV